MDEALISIQTSINERVKLLQEAYVLEERAKALRSKATENNLREEITSVQNEVFKLLDRIDLLNNLMVLACNSFDFEEEPIPISLENYQTFTIQGMSIEMIEKELMALTVKVAFLMNLLEQICTYVGHNYVYVKDEAMLDFDSLELSFEKKQIYYCAICGEALYLDLDAERNFDFASTQHLEKLRKARKMQIYESKFKIVDDLHR